ncbi:peptidylprolyl isomerase [Dehalogenimonas sp. 4OHTPN]|uniref:peptidylprolyl isomerase n=1 Tax=Dehalogenimonas sp. 4OHTPN TaxID=3166643 RepID=A0AAU8G755_9CHLR
MAKKKHKSHSHPTHTLSVKAQSKLAAQKKRQKITRWIGFGIIGAVAALLVVGGVTQWLLPVYLPLQKTVLTVNGTKFNAQYVARMVNYYTGGDPTYSYLFIDPVIDQITQNELMKQRAAELGITVSDDEVAETIKESGIKSNPTTRDIVYSSLLAEKLTEQKFKVEIGAAGPQRQVLAMLLESAAQAEAVRARLQAGESFADIAAELSLDTTTLTNKGDMGFHPEGILDGLLSADGLEAAVFAAAQGDIGFFYDENKSKQLGYWVLKVTEKKTENEVTTAKVSGILVPTIEKAEEIRARLTAGEDFAAVAKEASQDATTKDAGGDLGTLTQGTSTGPVADFVFSEAAVVDRISVPVQTKVSSTTGAYWLYQVKAVESSRTFTEDDLDTLVNAAFSEWLTAIKNDPANEIDTVELTDEQRDLIAEQSLA